MFLSINMHLVNLLNQLLPQLIMLNIFFVIIYRRKMEVNNHGQNNQIIYPQNIKKYTGSIQVIRSRAKNGNNKIVSFFIRIITVNFKYQKCFPSKQEAESELIRQNIENKLDIKNTMLDRGDHYLVRLHGNKKFLADKVDLPFIEAHIWFPSFGNYAACKQNGRRIMFHNLILNHIPSFNATVDHFNRCPFDNRRMNLRIAMWQTQTINRTPQNGTNQPGVSFNKNCWRASWVDGNKAQREACFSVNKYGYEVAKQLAIAKRLEIELSLNHYRIALHNLPPLEPEEPKVNYDFEEPDEPDEI